MDNSVNFCSYLFKNRKYEWNFDLKIIENIKILQNGTYMT